MMHWIDPNCLPETESAVEAFIMNRHGAIDRMILAEARQPPLLVCTPPHMATEIEAAVIAKLTQITQSGARRVWSKFVFSAGRADTTFDPPHERLRVF